MPATAISNLVVPQVWGAAAGEMMPFRSSLVRSGIVTTDNNPFFAAGDVLARIPTLRPLSVAGAPEILTANTALDITNITTEVQVSPVLRRGKAIGFEDNAKLAQGQDLMTRYVPQVAEYAATRMIDPAFEAVIRGAFASGGPLATSHSYSLVADTPVTKTIGLAAIQRTKAVLGDAGVTGFDTMIVHSKVYNDLIAQGIQFVANADFSSPAIINGTVPVFAGMRVIVNDNLCAVNETPNPDEYPTYLLGAGSLYLGYQRVLNIETDRNILLAGGTDILKFDAHFVCHVFGLKWTAAGTNPTDATLATGSNWGKVYDDRNIKLARLITQ
jgi:hypothetical protein